MALFGDCCRNKRLQMVKSFSTSTCTDKSVHRATDRFEKQINTNTYVSHEWASAKRHINKFVLIYTHEKFTNNQKHIHDLNTHVSQHIHTTAINARDIHTQRKRRDAQRPRTKRASACVYTKHVPMSTGSGGSCCSDVSSRVELHAFHQHPSSARYERRQTKHTRTTDGLTKQWWVELLC